MNCKHLNTTNYVISPLKTGENYKQQKLHSSPVTITGDKSRLQMADNET